MRMARNEDRMKPSSAQRDKSKSLERDVHCHPSLSRHCRSAILCEDGDSTGDGIFYIPVSITSFTHFESEPQTEPRDDYGSVS